MQRELIYTMPSHEYNYENRRVSTSTRSKRKAKRRKKAAKLFMRNLILIAIILLIILGGYRMQAQAAEPMIQNTTQVAETPQVTGSERVYITLQIQPGDTIWDISKHYCGSHDARKIKAYAKEIQEINSISNARRLRSGSFIVVYQDVPTT